MGSGESEEPRGESRTRRKPEIAERPGEKIGRFVIVSRLGEGAMGMVYLAYDPKLDRRVALKVLHRRARSKRALQSRQQRLLREAQAMAQLNHANVVTVHDVGVADERVFLAMDYVQGQTLRQWLDARRRPWQEVVPVIIAAARGLAAAHEAGVIHRDFKPENVLVSEDGSVKVMDFGLARPRIGEGSLRASDSHNASIDGERAPTAANATVSSDRSPTAANAAVPASERAPTGANATVSGDDEAGQGWWKGESGLIRVEGTAGLTRSGDVLGTPSYMAPELFDRAEANASTDQFALCVTLYEALYGVRPFAGESMAALAFNMNRQKITPPPRGVRVPAWLGRLARRGLSRDADRRFPSVQALIDELSRGAGRHRLRVAGVAAASLVAVVYGASYAFVADPVPCQGGDERVRQVWNPERAGAIARAFEATDVPYADEALERAKQRLDAYAETWVKTYTEVCEATAVRGEQAPELLDQRIACLDERLRELDALLVVLGEADRRAAERAAQAASGLRDPGSCADDDLTARPSSEDPARQAKIDTLRARMLRAEALERAGRYDDALALASEIGAEAELLGETALHAEAMLQLGTAEDMASNYPSASEHLRKAYFLANEAGLDLLSAKAAVALLTTEGIHMARSDDGLDWARHAKTAFERADPENVLLGRYHAALGSLHFQRSELSLAREHYESALTIERAALGEDHERVAEVLALLGAVQEQSGRSEDAVASFERAIEIFRSALGPQHPQLAKLHNNYAVVLFGRRDLPGAQAQLEQALAIYRKSMGDHAGTATFLDNLGALMLLQGKSDEGRKLIEEGLAMRERVLPPDHPAIANSLSNLGGAYEIARDWGAAQRSYERAIGILEKTGDPDTPQVARALLSLGTLALREGAIQRGYDQCKRSVEILEQIGGPQHPELTGPLTGLGWAQLELKQPGAALVTLERAYAMKDQGQGDAAAMAAMLLAKALDETDGDAKRARKLRAEARKGYAALRDFEPPERIAAWLDDPS